MYLYWVRYRIIDKWPVLFFWLLLFLFGFVLLLLLSHCNYAKEVPNGCLDTESVVLIKLAQLISSTPSWFVLGFSQGGGDCRCGHLTLIVMFRTTPTPTPTTP